MRKGKGIVDGIRKYSSVMALAVRSSFYKVLLVMIGMCVAEGVAFRRLLLVEAERYKGYIDELWLGELPFTFGELLEEGIFAKIFLCGMILVTAVLVWTECERGRAKSRMLLWRLRITPRQSYILWSVYNMACYVLLIAVQCILILAFYRIFQKELKLLIPCDANGLVRTQEIFLAFHTNSFLHGIMPLHDFWLGVRLLVAIIAWGMAGAYIGYIGYIGHNQRCAFLIMFLGYSIMFIALGVDIGWVNFLVITSAIICIIGIGISVKGGWGYELGET